MRFWARFVYNAAMKKIQFPLANDPFAAREAGKYERPTASREYIVEIIKTLGPPCEFDDIAEALGIAIDDDEGNIGLDRRIRAMLRDGQLVSNRKGGLLPVDEKDLVRGRVQAHPSGFGFLLPDEGGEELFIHAKQMDELFHNDHVVMRRAGNARGGKTEGRLVDVLERAHTHAVGQIFFEDSIAFMVPANRLLTQDILIAADKTMGAKHGQMVNVEITHQPTRRHQAQGRVVEILGDYLAPGMEIDVAIKSHHIPDEFSKEALQSAAELGDEVSEADKFGRKDYRHLPFITIDGDDAKDFDDAVYCEANARGWLLLVAIADVAHYVTPESALDLDAQQRATSVYFPGRVVPMLPEQLSNGLCSLKPNVDRLCIMCEMQIGSSGRVETYSFAEGIIRSRARTTYDEIGAILLGQGSAECSEYTRTYRELLPSIHELYSLYQAMAEARQARSAINFESVETKIVFGKDQKIEAILPLERHDAHKLIEECMIAANIAAACFLDNHKIPALYRAHAEPSPEKYEELREFLMSFAISIPAASKPDVKMYAKIAEIAATRPEARLIQTVLLRSMKQAVYLPECKGHFGLALSHYAHFTSPIRRYPDLLVHRAIRHVLQHGSANGYAYSEGQMVAFGEICSTAERRANDATRDAMDWLKCEFMLDKVGREYDGMITGVAAFGIFVELDGVYVEGMVHVSNLDKDYFEFDNIGQRLVGERTGKVYRLADKIRVQIARVDLDDSKIELELVSSAGANPSSAKRKRDHHER